MKVLISTSANKALTPAEYKALKKEIAAVNKEISAKEAEERKEDKILGQLYEEVEKQEDYIDNPKKDQAVVRAALKKAQQKAKLQLKVTKKLERERQALEDKLDKLDAKLDANDRAIFEAEQRAKEKKKSDAIKEVENKIKLEERRLVKLLSPEAKIIKDAIDKLRLELDAKKAA